MQSRGGEFSRLYLEPVRQNARLVAREAGKSIPSQIAEIAALRLGIGKLLPFEYYQYRLYDDRTYSWSEKKKFLGSLLENGLIPVLREHQWLGLANDKLTAYAFFKGLGLPIPETLAVCHPFRHFGQVPVLRQREELARFVRAESLGAFIAKPIFGMWGKDVWAVERYDARNDSLVLANGDAVKVDAFVESFARWFKTGILLQELLRPHPGVAALCGDRICSVRMVSLIDGSGPRLISTLLKITTGGNMADNYWAPGNLVAAVETATGRIARPFTGLGRDIRYVDKHPDTNQLLTGAVLPDWSRAVKLCLEATAMLPGIPMQAWDIALTSRGPVILEVNVNGGMRLPQLTRQGGLYTDELRDFLASFGYPRRNLLSRVLRRLRPARIA